MNFFKILCLTLYVFSGINLAQASRGAEFAEQLKGDVWENASFSEKVDKLNLASGWLTKYKKDEKHKKNYYDLFFAKLDDLANSIESLEPKEAKDRESQELVDSLMTNLLMKKKVSILNVDGKDYSAVKKFIINCLKKNLITLDKLEDHNWGDEKKTTMLEDAKKAFESHESSSS